MLGDYAGRDKIPGKQIQLNRQRLKVKKGKKYSEVVFFGDLHYGNPSCDLERAKRMLDYCLKNGIHVFLMGDLLEFGTRNSVGASVYEQEQNPQEQMEFVMELFEPLAKAELILGSLIGNHEMRCWKDSGINVMKVICKTLNIPYLGPACWNIFYVGDQSYTIYALHGASGARFVYTKLKSLVDISHSFDADLLAEAHVHQLADDCQLVQEVDRTRKVVIERKKFLVLTGHYLSYSQSYVQEKGYPISKLGSPKVKFWSDRKDIHISY